MLHVDLRKKPYCVTIFEVIPDGERQIPIMREQLERNFTIENPAKTFVRRMNSDEYAGYPEALIAEEARMINLLSEAWNFSGKENGGVPEANVMLVLTRLMQLYIDACMELDPFGDEL